MSFFLDALSDASTQMTETLTSVGQAFEAGWGRGLEALLERPAALFYLAVFAAFIVFMMGGPRGSRCGYQRGRFLTTNEKSFLMTLDAALGRNYRAFAQVRLAELANPTLGANPASRRQALNGVMAKSVDFVICDVLTLDPVAAIEVDDKSHLLPERQQRDAFVNAVFLEIGLPLMRVKARRVYSVDELRAMCARAGLFTLPRRMEGANS
jgi:very-short-patch-repair endonuclease